MRRFARTSRKGYAFLLGYDGGFYARVPTMRFRLRFGSSQAEVPAFGS